MGKFFGFLAIVLIGGFAYFSLRPMPAIHFEDTQKVIGTIEKISKQSNNVIIKLIDHDDEYIIKNGLKKGIFLQLIKKLEGKIVTIYFVKDDMAHFNPLDPFDTKKHVAKLKTMKGIVYNEIIE